jgi:hypothetical protein
MNDESDGQIRYQRNTNMKNIAAATELFKSETIAHASEITQRN